MHLMIANQQAQIAKICRDHRIRRLAVFGSAARGTDFDSKNSDADFIVEFLPDAKPDLSGWYHARIDLERLLGRPVDLVEYHAVRNPFLRAEIDRHGELVYAV